MLEPLTDGNDGGVWPTPTAFDASTPANISPEARERQLRRGDPNGSRRTSSGSLAKEVLWPTPVANDTQRSPQAALEAKLRMGGNRTEITSLNVISKLWPTPAAHDAKMTGQIENNRHSAMLPEAAVLWPTPTAGIAHRGTDPERTNDRAGAPTFKAVAMMWPTPRAMESVRSSPKGTAGPTLIAAAVGRDPLDPLPWPPQPKEESEKMTYAQELEEFSRRQEMTPKAGNSGSTKVDLNPWFVAALMGLPADWLTHSTSAVTDSCRNALQKQSDNYLTEQDGK